MNLVTLRDEMKKRRQQLTKEVWRRCSEQVSHHLFKTDFYQNSHKIACYFSCHNELNTELILNDIFFKNKSCYLPKIFPNNKMGFVAYQPEDTLQKNQFGILEPTDKGQDIIKINQLDLVLAPLVAFDKQGNRLGMGKGYYDKALANKAKKPFYCGLAYAFQQVEWIEARVWDVRLQAAITEKEVVIFI